MKMRFVNLLLMLFLSTLSGVFAQESYNSCANAFKLCPNKKVSLNNIGASTTVCSGCEDDVITCFTHTNSIWMKFTTNATGGNVSIALSNLVFDPNPIRGFEIQMEIFEVGVACNPTTYLPVPFACNANILAGTTMTATGLLPNKTYYVVVNGNKNALSLPAECTFDIEAYGIGIDRPNPIGVIAVLQPAICENELTQFACYLSNCPDSSVFVWKLNGVLVATTANQYYQSNSIQTGDVLTVSNSCYQDCAEDIFLTSSPFVVQSFAVNAGPDFTINAGEGVTLQGSTSGTSYNWGPVTGLNFTDSLKPLANPTETTTYFLTAKDSNCSQTDEMTVFVNAQILIPNLFSPNGDGDNDTWEIINIASFPDTEVSIYDRWGQLVYEGIGYSYAKAWDGTRKGKPLPEGVYFYKIDLNTKKADEVRKGYVTLVR